MGPVAALEEPLTTPRDGALRRCYAKAVLAEIPRIIGSLDRNPLRATFGCFDRQFWHYRTAAFPSEMYQEAVYPLAWAYANRVPGNRWHQCAALRDWTIAALRYSARSGHADGSCDDYYPYERALGAAVFSLVACAKACELLQVGDTEILAGLMRRARWIAAHDEAGRLTNHHALAALALLRMARLTGERELMRAAEARIERVLAWQHAEGWFAEYDGADPGYQTVTIACLAEYRQLTGRDDLTGPLQRACDFARWFLHSDASFGGPYGSRGTRHCYPHGFELLAGESPSAGDVADACVAQLSQDTAAAFDDDRLFSHRLVSLCDAYDHWSPARSRAMRKTGRKYFRAAGLFVQLDAERHTVISLARGGAFTHCATGDSTYMDSGLVVELEDGQVGVSQQHQLPENDVELTGSVAIQVQRRLTAVHWETATPGKQALLHVGMITLGRWCRGLTRRLLQRRLISARRELPIRCTRSFEFLESGALRVTDIVALEHPRARVRRLMVAVDLQAAYTAASAVYHDAVLQPWTDLSRYVEQLNQERSVTIVREFPV